MTMGMQISAPRLCAKRCVHRVANQVDDKRARRNPAPSASPPAQADSGCRARSTYGTEQDRLHMPLSRTPFARGFSLHIGSRTLPGLSNETADRPLIMAPAAKNMGAR